MNSKIARIAAILLAGIVSVSLSAQSYTIKGNVTDAVGPVIGATVIEQGTTNGVSTGLDGEYVLTVSSKDAIVEISCIGYATQSFAASAVPANVVLSEDATFLDDVVVIGYGTVKKDDLTGSVATVKADEVNKGVATSPSDLLKGKSAGVVVTPGNGAPGSGSTIRIRGGSSLSANNDPLIVIDGLPVSNEGISGMADALSSINPGDIESFTVLKDASATAIYGSRASNGVIVITTKKGSKFSSKIPKIALDFTTSLATPAKYVDMMTGDEVRAAVASLYGEDSDAYKALGTENTNWQKEIYRLAPSYEANLSVTGKVGMGAAGYLPYRVSGGFIDQDGILKTGNMSRGTLALNLSPSFLEDHLTVALNGKGTFAKNRFANADAVGNALHYDPTKPVYDELGNNGYTTWYDGAGNMNTMATQNPVALLEEKVDLSDANRFIGSAQVDYKVHGFEDLRLNLSLGMDYAKSNGTVDVPTGAEQSFHSTQQSGSGFHTDYDYTRMDQTLEAYAAYAHDFTGGHHFDAMAGYSWQHFWNASNNKTYKLTTSEVLSDTHPKSEYFLVSFFGRVNYGYDNRYMVTATLRRDGTSRFQNNKWGLFPSVALGWNIKNESFLKNAEPLSALKLRLSWGQTGQQDINAGNYPTLATYYTNLIGSQYQFGGVAITPVTALGYNADLKWETTTTYNVALDYGFFNDRLTGSLDFYARYTKDLINYIPVPALSNLTNYLSSNIGDLRNIGFEFEVNAIPVQTRDWNWTIGANFAYNKNTITKLTASENDKTGVETGGIAGGVGNMIQMHQVGFPTSAYYVYQQVYDKETGKPIPGAYVDRNGNGRFDADDRYFFHKPAHDVTVGLNTQVSWKNLTLALSGHGGFGGWNYNNVQSENEKLVDLWTNSFVSNRIDGALNNGFKNGEFYSDYYVQDASFFKIDNITLSYTFPSLCKIVDDRSLGMNVFFTVQNVATITKYKGIDPEVFGGIDGYIYPRPRTFVLGVKFNF